MILELQHQHAENYAIGQIVRFQDGAEIVVLRVSGDRMWYTETKNLGF